MLIYSFFSSILDSEFGQKYTAFAKNESFNGYTMIYNIIEFKQFNSYLTVNHSTPIEQHRGTHLTIMFKYLNRFYF